MKNTSMKYMMRCAVNGIDLYSISDRIYIQEIEEKPALKVETMARPFYGMIDEGFMAHDQMAVKITFMIKEYDRIFRADILEKICAWATMGYLTVNTRPNRRMYVRCTELPTMKTFAWHEDMSIVFTAYGEACWEDETPLTKTITATTEAVLEDFNVRGTLPCFLEAEIVNASGGTLSEIVLTANGETISLTGLSVPDTGKVELRYDERHYQVITANGVSILAYRSGADDLILNPGHNNQISCVTDAACNVTFMARGMYR